MGKKLEYIGGGQFVIGRVIDGVYSRDNIGPDYNFPGVAQELGWNLRRVQMRKGEIVVLKRSGKGCEHRGTDGSVKCPECGVPALAFIEAAGDYLRERAE